MKVYKLTDEEKAILAGFTEEQKKINAIQADLNARVKAATDALCMARDLKPPLVPSECGGFLVEGQMRGGPGMRP